MSEFRELYKRLGFGRENNEINREIRTQRRNCHRRERRSQLFGVHREQNQCSDQRDEASSKEEAASSSKQRDEAAKSNNAEGSKQLESWRKDKYRRKLLEKKMKKPPFIVGIVRHRLYSPPLSKNLNSSPPEKLCKSKENQPVAVLKKTVTKATENRQAAKFLESKQPKNENRKIRNFQETKKLPLAPKDHEFKAPEGINAIPLFGRRAMEAAQQSVLKSYKAPNIANISIASFHSEEGRCSLNRNNTSTPLPTAVPHESPQIFVISPTGKEPRELNFSKTISSPSKNESVNESPTKLWQEETTDIATLKNTISPVQPYIIVISDEKGNARTEKLRASTDRSSAMDFLRDAEPRKSIFGKNHGYGGTPKKSPRAQTENALIEQTPLSSQMFSHLSPFRIVYRSDELSHESLKNSSYDEARNSPAPLPMQLSGCLSPMSDPHSDDEGDTLKELQRSAGEKRVQVNVHLESEPYELMKNFSHDESRNALIEQAAPLTTQLSGYSSSISDPHSDEGGDLLKELEKSKEKYVHTNVHLENEARELLNNLSHNEARNILVEQPAPLTTQLSGYLSPMKNPHTDEGSTHKELQKSVDRVEMDCSNEDKYTIQYFKRLLVNETERLNGLCDSWGLVKNEISTPEDIKYLIQAAIGQTQLLIRKKFTRFRGLVEDCETGEGEMPVTRKDLLGFWELVYIEVEDCNARFSKLEQLKANRWIHANSPRNIAEKQRQKLAVKITAVQAKRKVAPSRSNSLKAHIMAARKNMKSEFETVDVKAEQHL